MDGENNGQPYFLMDDLGGNTPIFGLTPTWKELLLKTNAENIKLLGPKGLMFSKTMNFLLKWNLFKGHSESFSAVYLYPKKFLFWQTYLPCH